MELETRLEILEKNFENLVNTLQSIAAVLYEHEIVARIVDEAFDKVEDLIGEENGDT